MNNKFIFSVLIAFILTAYVKVIFAEETNNSKKTVSKVETCSEWSWIGWNDCVGTRKYEQDQITYTGEFKRNFPAGKGRVEYWATGLVYEGEYSKGAPNGFGAQIDKNGFKYFEGNFSRGFRHGQGTFFFDRDDKFGRERIIGNFSSNSLEKGEITFKNGDTYIGEVNGQFLPNGMGKKIFSDGMPAVSGFFKMGAFQEKIRSREEFVAQDYPYFVEIRCKLYNEKIMNPVYCFNGSNGIHGAFEINNQGRHTAYNAANFFEIPEKIYLSEAFQIVAQNVSDTFILEMEIFSTISGKSVFQQQASKFGTIKVKN